jgi:hypothetical protein
MSTIFNVTCPKCEGLFPVHSERWNAGYDLLCPFCGNTFSQNSSPLIIGGAGERITGTPAAAPSTTDTGAAEGM